jgi:hypothetical protein
MPIMAAELSSRTRDFLGTFCRELSAASRIEDYELQLMDPTFANEFVGLKTVFFQDLGAGDGNRTHDIQLGKLSFYH